MKSSVGRTAVFFVALALSVAGFALAQTETWNQEKVAALAGELDSASLHAQLVKGAGMEETLPTYPRIQRLKRDAQVLAKKTEVTAFTKPKLDRATEVLSLLAPFYPAQPVPKSESKS